MIKLNIYSDFDSLSKNLSKKNICKTSYGLRFLEFAMFLILPFKLSEPIILENLQIFSDFLFNTKDSAVFNKISGILIFTLKVSG